MNNVLMIILIFFGVGCSDKGLPEEELIAIDYSSRTTEQEETQEVFTLDLEQYGVINRVSILEEIKKDLVQQIEEGNSELLPDLEAVVNELRTNYNSLEIILDNTCLLLQLRYEVLTKRLSEGDETALDELLKIKENLEKCGIDVEDYLFEIFNGQPIIYLMSWGSRCSPGREWKCKNIMKQGKLLLNVEEELANRIEARFKSASGEVISTGMMVGNHKDLRGISQIELDLNQIEQGILEISTENGRIEVPIEVQ